MAGSQGGCCSCAVNEGVGPERVASIIGGTETNLSTEATLYGVFAQLLCKARWQKNCFKVPIWVPR